MLGYLRPPQFKNTLEEMGQHFLNSHTRSPVVEGFLVIKTQNVNFFKK